MLVTLTNQQGMYSSARTFNVNSLEEYNNLIKQTFNEATLGDDVKKVIYETREYFKALANTQHTTQTPGGEPAVEEGSTGV